MTNANSSVLMGASKSNARWIIALRDWRGLAAAILVRFRQLAPYALIELILPGGSVMALLLWLYRRKNRLRFGGFPVELLASLQ